MSEQLALGSVYPPVPVPPESMRSIRTHVDALIDWYERFNPTVRTVAVNCRPATLRKFCKKQRKGPFVYREREIVPMRKPRAVEA